MYLQGNLQTVFDALYHLGVIDPVLDMDWSKALHEIHQHAHEVSAIVLVANSYQGDVEKLTLELKKFDQKTLGYLAMEVAREYADFHARQNIH
ncbi:MAG: cytochrome [Bdellovibrionales bacterium]|nr:cytochrome [Bdellovibrionales bacterium]